MHPGIAALVSAVFPRFCVACKKEGELLCRSCDELWHPASSVLPLTKGEVEGMDGITSLLRYADPAARQLITAWKYHYDASAWAALRRKLSPQLPLLHLRTSLAGIEAVVPVSLSRKRFCERGFDQAEEIAEWVSSGVHLPVFKLLQRKWTYGHQADRVPDERQRAMANSPFVIDEAVKDLPIRVLLVDDVWTTGSTMQAAARTLRAAGVEVVQYFTLAKG